MDNETINEKTGRESTDSDSITTPRIIYWTGPPPQLTREHIIDVLKSDLLIIPCDPHLTSFHLLKKKAHQRTIFFFNLDFIIEKNNIKKEHVNTLTLHLNTFLTNLAPIKSLVYSQEDRDFFHTLFTPPVLALQKNPFPGKDSLVDTIHTLADTLFLKQADKDKYVRSSYRLFLLPLKYTVKAGIQTGKKVRYINGYMKDLSLNGVSLLLKNPGLTDIMQQGTNLSLQLYLYTTIVRIHSCTITRVDPAHGEIGVWYDVHNHSHISESDGDTLSSLMYSWMQQVIRQYRV
jgi:hypothetical protein